MEKLVVSKDEVIEKILHEMNTSATRHRRANSDQDLLLGDLAIIELHLKILKAVIKSEYDGFTVRNLESFKDDLMKSDPIFGGSLKKQEQVIETYF